MDFSDKLSEDVIKIFHNAKGSIVNDVMKWAQDLKEENKVSSRVRGSADKQIELYLTREIDKTQNFSILSEQSDTEYEQS